MNASFLSGARPGDRIVVEGRVLRMGKTIAFGEAEARRNGDRLIAKGRLTFAIRNRGSEGWRRRNARPAPS
jgi:acyl-coenzyme A thioesterase PaaI-like protein